jgi:hypothetical protein
LNHSGQKQQRRASRRDREDEPSRLRQTGFAFELEVHAMWFLPLSVTLEVKRTRTGWLFRIRVHINF